MKSAIVFAALAALSIGGCKKKNEAAPAAAGSAAATPAKTAETPPAPAAKGKTCEELGGTKQGDTCSVKTPSPFEITWTNKFDTDMMHPEPGAVFKVTNESDQKLIVSNANLYAYDKDGKQLEIDAGGKSKFAQDSSMNMLELDPGKSKDLVHSVGKKNLPAEMATLVVEITSWSQDGAAFTREVGDLTTRPKDGWK